MEIVFQWTQIKLPEDQRLTIEKRFSDDFKTLLSGETHEASVLFEKYLPAVGLKGFVTDQEGKKLYVFDCQPSNNFTINYTKL